MKNNRYRPTASAETTGEIFKRDTYKCPELGRTCTRPGAYDAFDKPSIYAGQERPYRFAQETTK